MAVFNLRTTLELTYQCPHATSLLEEDFSPIDNPIMTPVGAKADVCRRQVRLIVIATLGPVKAQPGVSAEINANIKAAGIARARGAEHLASVAGKEAHAIGIQTCVIARALTRANTHVAIAVVQQIAIRIIDMRSPNVGTTVFLSADKTLTVPVLRHQASR